MLRGMVFIDGENLVCGYQEMLEAGATPSAIQNFPTRHVKDVYVYNALPLYDCPHINFCRVTYYTSIVGDDVKVAEMKTEIKNLQFNQYGEGLKAVHPFVVKKNNNERRSKGVDIQLTVDMLSHSFRRNIDVAYLMTGDGDFVPAVEEAKRNGCQVYVCAFSRGLNQKLYHAADQFIDLDRSYFQRK